MVCNESTAVSARKELRSVNDSGLTMLTLDEINGIEKSSSVKTTNSLIDIEPVMATDIEVDVCLLIWSSDVKKLPSDYERLTHADVFISSMQFYLRHGRGMNTGVVHQKNACFRKPGIFLSLIAMERKLLYVLEESQSHNGLQITCPFEKLEYDSEEEHIENCQGMNSCPEKCGSLPLGDTKETLIESSNIDSQDQSGEAIRKYYEKYKTNPPWQKGRGGKFACPHCNLDCENDDGLEKHTKFYHTPRITSNDSCMEQATSSNNKESSVNDSSLKIALASLDNAASYDPDRDVSDNSSDSTDSDAYTKFEVMNEKNYEDCIDKANNLENCNHDPYWAMPGPSSSSKNCMDSPVKSSNERMENGEKECRYCRRKFEDSSVYDNHFSECYDRYAYMHM